LICMSHNSSSFVVISSSCQQEQRNNSNGKYIDTDLQPTKQGKRADRISDHGEREKLESELERFDHHNITYYYLARNGIQKNQQGEPSPSLYFSST